VEAEVLVIMIGFEPASPDNWVVNVAVKAVLERYGSGLWVERKPGARGTATGGWSWRQADLKELVEFIVDAAFEAAA
jgi:hypothetical protein